MNRAKIAVGLSGGVDSAVSASLLKNLGHEVVGVHLYCWPPKEEYLVSSIRYLAEEKERLKSEWIRKNGCRADEDKKAALKTALELGVPFKTLDFSEEYSQRVVNYFYREYEAGRTPNPDVLCNSEIKFGLFLDWALENGFDYVATGHYAEIRRYHSATVSQCYSLHIPKDKHKDQTYFLWKLTQKELAHVLFPLADLTKPEVRKIAKEAGLSVADRPDSQGICFVGNVDARKFLARRLEEKAGAVKNTKGEVIGYHKGIWFYTIGQRGGWDIFPAAQRKIAVTQCHRDTPSFYVISKDAKKNELVVGEAAEAVAQRFQVAEVNWIGQIGVIGQIPGKILVRIRHGGMLIVAELGPIGQMGQVGRMGVILKEGERGVAPGQSAVFYSEDGQVLGGGVIT